MSSGSQHGSADDQARASTLGALRRLSLVVAAFGVCAVGSYVVPGLDPVRPWLPGEGVPIARMFSERTQVPDFAEVGLLATDGSQGEAAEVLGSDVARHLETDSEPASSQHDSTEDARPDSDASAAPAVRIDSKEYEGVAQEIEFSEALRYFFDRLRSTAARKTEAITRVAHYGDSSVAADAITHTVRRRLQQRFGDAGHGFVLISRGDMHYAHKDIVHRTSDGWSTYSIVRDQLGKDWYGYGGVQVRGDPGEYARFGTVDEGPVGRKVSRFELFFQRNRRGGKVVLRVDRGERRVIETRSKDKEDAFEVIEVPDGEHQLSLRVRGRQVRLYGVALERSIPGVVYDSLGLVGARAERLLNAEKSHFQRQIAHRSPALLVLGFGGNEAGNAWLKLDRYEHELVEVVRAMRGGKREMSCLLFGPLDQGERDARGRVVTIGNLPEIVEVQRRVAEREGCAFFDVFQAMGGEGSIARWRKSRPRLATSDLRHATPKGYEVIGNMYYKALLKAFAEYLARK